MIKHRDIGHHWGFSQDQHVLLHYYQNANRMLLDCMNAARSLSTKTRDWVEATMCLPQSEIDKIPRPELRNR